MINKSNAFRKLVSMLALLGLMGCFYDEGGIEALPEDTVVSYAQDIQPIFNTNCTSCHPLIVSTPDLTDDNSYDTLIMNGYIVSKDLEASILYQRLLGKPSVMPPSGPLSQKDLDLFKKWIAQGALDN